MTNIPNNEKHYKNIHITTEFGLQIFGGIGSLVKTLYENRTEDDLFIAFNLTEEACAVEDTSGVVFLMPQEFEEDFILKYKGDNIIFHNYLTGSYFIGNCKNITDYKLYNISHSNPLYEHLFYKTTTQSEMVDMYYYVLENLDGMIFISDYEKRLFMELKEQFKLKVKDTIRYITIYNGLELSDGDFKLKSEEEHTNVYGYIGRLDARKGIIELLPHFKNLPDKTLYIATGGAGKFDVPMYWEFIDSFNFNNIHSNLLPLGFIQQQRKRLFFEKIDALIVPSLYEPFGLVLLEAFEYNRPVFCNKTGGILEILGEDYPFYFDVFDEDELKRVSELYESMPKDELEKYFTDLKNSIRERYSAEQMVDGYKNI